MRSTTRPAAASRKWKLGSEKHSTLGRQNPRENQHWLATDEVRNQARLRPAKENQKRLLRSSAKKKSFCAATCLSRKRRRHARWRKSHGRKPDGSRNLETQKKRPESQSSAQNGVGENLWRGRLSATAKTGVWEQLRIDTGRVAKIDSRKNPTALGAQTEPGNGSPEATLTGNKENRNLVTLA
jgi:hypothetical protein